MIRFILPSEKQFLRETAISVSLQPVEVANALTYIILERGLPLLLCGIW